MEEALTDAKALATDFFSVVIGGELGPEERIPKLSHYVDLYIFLLYAAAMLAINWSVRIVLVQPFARLCSPWVCTAVPSPVLAGMVYRC